MKQKLEIYQYGSQLDPTGPTSYSPGDWIEISFSESSPSERSGSIGAPQVSNSSTSESDASFTDLSSEDLLLKVCRVLEERMDSIGMELPPGIKMEEFVRWNLLAEDTVRALDPSLLTRVLADLQLASPIISWYWEATFREVLLLHGVIL
jgi:hypothetical protein